MSRKSFLFALVIAAVPAVARDGSGPPPPPAWSLFDAAPPAVVATATAPLASSLAPVAELAELAELDGLVALLAGLALALGLAWRRL